MSLDELAQSSSLPAMWRNGDVEARILAMVQEAGYEPGSKIPTERQFALDLQVSRSDVRHALARLESAGRISRAVGRGTFLRHTVDTPPSPADSFPLADIGPADVMTVRALLEPHSMPLTVARATQQDIDEMYRCVAGGESSSSFAEFEEWDLALHHSLIVAAHNPLLVRLYAAVVDARQGHLWGQLKRRTDSPERRNRYMVEHRKIVEAVSARDSPLATQAVASHLTTVTMDLFGHLL